MLLKDFEARANHVGLVPMEVLVENLTPYKKGKIAGFSPVEAKVGYEAETLGFPGEERKPKKAKETPAEQAADPRDAVEIPDDWETSPYLKRLNVAAKLKGVKPSDISGDDEVKRIVRDEIRRRSGTTGVLTSGDVPTTPK